jgi:hypothetical protein
MAGSVKESIDQVADAKQVVERGECCFGGNRCSEVGPIGGNERLAAVRKNQREIEPSVAMEVSEQFQGLSFKRMPRSSDGDAFGKVVRVGSVS